MVPCVSDAPDYSRILPSIVTFGTLSLPNGGELVTFRAVLEVHASSAFWELQACQAPSPLRY